MNHVLIIKLLTFLLFFYFLNDLKYFKLFLRVLNTGEARYIICIFFFCEKRTNIHAYYSLTMNALQNMFGIRRCICHDL